MTTTIRKQLKTFATFRNLIKKADGRNIFIKLTNGYMLPVLFPQLESVEFQMKKNDEKFCGRIIEEAGNYLLITID